MLLTLKEISRTQAWAAVICILHSLQSIDDLKSGKEAFNTCNIFSLLQPLPNECVT